MTPSVFDVDGCLADTLPLVQECYEAVGAEGVTLEDVKKHWSLWLPDLLLTSPLTPEDVRRHKTDLYLSRLHEGVRALPAARLARELLDGGEEVRAVTAANPRTTPKVLALVGLADLPILRGEVLPERRPALLRAYAARGTYYDDDAMTCALVQDETGWAAVPV